MIVVVGWFRLLTLLHELDPNMITVKNQLDQTPLEACTNGLVRLCLCLFFCVDDTLNTSTNRLVRLCLYLFYYVSDTSNISTRRMCIWQDHSLFKYSNMKVCGHVVLHIYVILYVLSSTHIQ